MLVTVDVQRRVELIMEMHTLASGSVYLLAYPYSVQCVRTQFDEVGKGYYCSAILLLLFNGLVQVFLLVLNAKVQTKISHTAAALHPCGTLE